jgi:hypothetical protein
MLLGLRKTCDRCLRGYASLGDEGTSLGDEGASLGDEGASLGNKGTSGASLISQPRQLSRV